MGRHTSIIEPLRGPTCKLKLCKISSTVEIPSWTRVWQLYSAKFPLSAKYAISAKCTFSAESTCRNYADTISIPIRLVISLKLREMIRRWVGWLRRLCGGSVAEAMWRVVTPR